ncbi:TBC1 domain family member 25 isoform 2-T2 [Amazona ochrocephala]
MAAPGGGAALEEECEVVRVRVKKSEGLQPPEFRSFAVDPQITSLDVLQHILARAFDLQGKKSFSISFAARDPQGQESFVPLLSDGDLAAAFAGARPALRLRLDVRPPAESPLLEDWDIISPREVAAVEPLPERRSLLAAALPFTQALLAQVGRTLARAQAALAWPEGSPPSPPLPPPPCAPLSDADLRTYLGPGGRLLRPHDLRLHVYHGGVEPGLRKVVWRYLLNVFPPGLSGQERLAHLRRKAGEYTALKEVLAARAAPAELALVAAAVRKDVVRTDRGHPYFGGPEEGHPHLAALQALLTTFALGHPRLSYCQGMSDVAAPLLAVLDDEAQAFLCFCSLMRRLGPRFRPGGRGLARAFSHLRRLLRRADPPFWAFLAARGAHDLLFCYRWLLLELKREFAFEDALRVLEITWSSLPPAPPPPPDGIPLLGAPLGPRRACRGLQERRGLRPRPPRRLRRQRQRMGAAVDGQEGSSDGSEVFGGGPEAPKRFGDEQETPKSSRGVPEGLGSSRVIQSCGDEQEGLQSSNIIKDGSGGNCEKLEVFGDGQACPDPEGWEISRDVHGSNKGQGGANDPRGLQAHPKASSDGGQDAGGPRDTGEAQEPGFSKQTHEAHRVSKKPGGDQDALEKSIHDHSASKAIGGLPYVPRDVRGDPDLLRVLGDTRKEVGGSYSCSLGQGGEDPTEVDRDPKEGEDLRQVGEDHTEVPKDPSEVDGDPKEGICKGQMDPLETPQYGPV